MQQGNANIWKLPVEEVNAALLHHILGLARGQWLLRVSKGSTFCPLASCLCLCLLVIVLLLSLQCILCFHSCSYNICVAWDVVSEAGTLYQSNVRAIRDCIRSLPVRLPFSFPALSGIIPLSSSFFCFGGIFTNLHPCRQLLVKLLRSFHRYVCFPATYQ